MSWLGCLAAWAVAVALLSVLMAINGRRNDE